MKKLLLVGCMILVALAIKAESITRHAWTGTISGNIPVEIIIEQNGKNHVAGEIRYTRMRDAKPMLLVGQVSYGEYLLTEYDSNGKETGVMTFKTEKGTAKGTWGAGHYGETPRPLELTKEIDFPDNRKGILVAEEPANIGTMYSYSFFNPNYKADMGGQMEITPVGKNLVYFSVSNAPGNIAEGKSQEDRPAVLKGNHFTYKKVNECGYSFEAYFYTKFVILRTTSNDKNAFDCFGANVSFDGIYIRKQ